MIYNECDDGWKEIRNKLTKMVDEQKFAEQQTNVQRMKFLLSHQGIVDKLTKFLIDNRRQIPITHSVFASSREDGLAAFRKGDYETAMRHFKNLPFICLTMNRYSNPDFIKAVGNRSATSFRLGNYTHCLSDIHFLQAQQPQSMPKEFWLKLLLRKGWCHSKLNQKVEFDEVLRKLDVEYTDVSKSDMDRIDQFRQQATQTEFKNIASESSLKDYILPIEHVRREYDTKFGQHFVATHDVEGGEVLYTEKKPYAYVALQTKGFYDWNYCGYCLKQISACSLGFPGPSCNCLKYCCRECADSHESVHSKYECAHSKFLPLTGVGELAIRIICATDFLSIIDVFEKYLNIASDDDLSPIEEEGGITQSDYQDVFTLLTHSTVISVQDQIQYSMTALALVQVLFQTGYFQEFVQSTRRDVSECKLMVGCLLLRHIQQMICNAHTISNLEVEVTSPDDMVEIMQQVRIASAVYPNFAFNHSCKPNAFISFNGTEIVLRASEPIKKGKQIFTSYGPHYIRMPKHERQAALEQQYRFSCGCPPCTDDAIDQMPFHVKCEYCGGMLFNPRRMDDRKRSKQVTCLDCNKPMSTERASQYRDYAQHREFGYAAIEQEKDSCIQVMFLQNAWNRHQAVLPPDNWEVGQLADRLAQAYIREEDLQQAKAYLEISIKCVERWFGSHSIELSNELQKLGYLQLKTGDGRHVETFKRAFRISGTRCGDEEDFSRMRYTPGDLFHIAE